MTSQQGLGIGAGWRVRWLDSRDDLAPSDDRVVLSAMLDAIENVGEAPGRLGGAHFRHVIRLSDLGAADQLSDLENDNRPPKGPGDLGIHPARSKGLEPLTF